jgi:hypothetical protein
MLAAEWPISGNGATPTINSVYGVPPLALEILLTCAGVDMAAAWAPDRRARMLLKDLRTG